MPRRQVYSLGSGPNREGFALRNRTIRRALRGFTLVEMLVVIAIIGMLMGLLLPAIQSARESARRTQCSNGLLNIIKAMINYESANRSFPPGRMGCDAFTGSPCGKLPGNQTPGTSAFLAILPQLDESPLYSSFAPLFAPSSPGGVYPATSDATTSGWSALTANNVTVAQTLATARPKIFVCPSDNAQPANNFLTPPTTTSSYALVMGCLGANPVVVTSPNGQVVTLPAADDLHQKYYNNGPFVYLLPRRSADVRDGLSMTLFVGEVTNGDAEATMNSWPVSVACLSSMRSTNNLLNTPAGSGVAQTIYGDSGLTNLPSSALGAFSSNHAQVANFAYGDGHVGYVSNMIDLPTYQALSTIAGSETISASDSWK